MFSRWHRVGVGGGIALAICISSTWGTLAATPSATMPSAAQVPTRDANKKNPIPADDGSRATGKQVYPLRQTSCKQELTLRVITFADDLQLLPIGPPH